MHFVKIETSDEDVRWINLDLVSRVTLGLDESGVETLIAMFSNGDISDSLKIRGTDDLNKAAILTVQRELNHRAL